MSSQQPFGNGDLDTGSPGESIDIPPRRDDANSTVGTGSTLGIGCVIAIVAMLVVAFAARWILGAW